MALLRLLTLCTVLSTALSFVAMAPPTKGSTPLAAATSRAAPSTAAAWGLQQRRGRIATSLNAGGYVCVRCGDLDVLGRKGRRLELDGWGRQSAVVVECGHIRVHVCAGGRADEGWYRR